MTNVGQFLLFAVVGGLSALVNIVARFFFSMLVPFEAAVVLAFPVALTFAFVLNRRFVFNAGMGSARVQYRRFLLVNLVALVQVFAVSVLLARAIFPWIAFEWHAETVAHIVGVLSPVVTSYVFHKSYTFRATGA